MPGDVNTLPELAAMVRDLKRRLDGIERGNQLGNAAITAGALTVYDGANVARAILGQLPNNDYGIRINDAAGNSILDSQGLRQVMATPLSGYAVSNQPAIVGNGSLQNVQMIAGQGTSFTLARATNVLVWCTLGGRTSGTTGNFFVPQLTFDGGQPIAALPGLDKANAGYQQSSQLQFYYQMPAGTYTPVLQVKGDVGQSLDINSGKFIIFTLGS